MIIHVRTEVHDSQGTKTPVAKIFTIALALKPVKDLLPSIQCQF